MGDNEFSDLEKFGKVLEKPSVENSPKEKKKGEVLPKKDLKKLALKILKSLWRFVKILAKKTKDFLVKIFVFLKTKRQIRRRYKEVIKRNKKSNNVSYKIVETKKQRGNKTIIVRRRVPSYFDIKNPIPKTHLMGSIYYLSLDKDSENEVRNASYTILKKSVWDFPIEDKSIFRRTFNTLKIQRLFKK